MSILKTILILGTLAATISSAVGAKGYWARSRGRTLDGNGGHGGNRDDEPEPGPGGRWKLEDGEEPGPGGRWKLEDGEEPGPGGRWKVEDEAVADAAATPEAADNQAELSDALAVASDAVEALASEPLSAPEQAAVGAEIVENIAAAVEIAADAPQAQEVQADVVALKGEEFFDELEKNLFFAKKYQKALAKFGTTMSADEVIEYQTSLHSFLEKAFFFAQQNFKTFQQGQAIADGEHPADVAAVGTALTLEAAAPGAVSGRRMRGGRRAMKKGRLYSAGCAIKINGCW